MGGTEGKSFSHCAWIKCQNILRPLPPFIEPEGLDVWKECWWNGGASRRLGVGLQCLLSVRGSLMDISGTEGLNLSRIQRGPSSPLGLVTLCSATLCLAATFVSHEL